MSLTSQTSPSLQESETEKLYFAYGSNMHLQQMATRCQDSTLFAIGILRGYRWQLNSRGGANVARGKQDDFVEGIVFTVSSRDVQALRRYERVTEQFFIEEEAFVEVESVRDLTLEGQKSTNVAQVLAQHRGELKTAHPVSRVETGVGKQKDIKSKTAIGFPLPSKSGVEAYTARYGSKSRDDERILCKVLVYKIRDIQVPGRIREEYAARMKLAMADACMLGVSEKYLEMVLRPQVFSVQSGTY